MNTKSIMRNLAMCSLAAVLGSVSLHSAAENKDMMSDRDSDYKHSWMMGGGMGSGMMGGDMGSCMMGGGMGSGMMGHRAEMLDITDEQRATMRKITADLRRSNIERMSKIMDVHDQLAELYEKEPLDAKAIGSVYGQIFDLRQQMIEAGIEAKNKKRKVLNKE